MSCNRERQVAFNKHGVVFVRLIMVPIRVLSEGSRFSYLLAPFALLWRCASRIIIQWHRSAPFPFLIKVIQNAKSCVCESVNRGHVPAVKPKPNRGIYLTSARSGFIENQFCRRLAHSCNKLIEEHNSQRWQSATLIKRHFAKFAKLQNRMRRGLRNCSARLSCVGNTLR